MKLDGDEIAVLQLVAARGVGEKTLARLLMLAHGTGESLADVVALKPTELAMRFGLGLSSAEALRDVREAAARTAESLERNGISMLIRYSRGYPRHLEQALGDTSPPVLFVGGDTSILDEPAVGIGGSRKASAASLTLAGDAAGILARNGINVVSGNANGVDLTAHVGALVAGGTTTFVLPEGILGFRPRGHLAEVFEDGRSLVVSEFPPSLTWIARNAMRRNRTICGLSKALVVIEARATGGTFAAGQTALEMRRPVFVAEHAGLGDTAAGSRMLIARGATALQLDSSGQLQLSEVIEHAHIVEPVDPESQLRLI